MLQNGIRRRGRAVLSWLTTVDRAAINNSEDDVRHQPGPSYMYYGRSPSCVISLWSQGCETPPAAQPQRNWFTTVPPKPDCPKDGDVSKPTSTWICRLPHSWKPYAELSRLGKPIGTWLLAWPCFWSIALAAPSGGPIDVKLLALFGAGSLLLRGAGCTINDLWDQDLDKKVVRTRTRPLASGTISSQQAIAWLGVQLIAGLGVLVQLNPYSQALGASSLVLVTAYPLMKRITGWPQAFLGLTFNWGALLGWAAAQGSCDWSVVLPLYAGGVCWTLVYDTIYAHQDKLDDMSAGIKSTALTFGQRNRQYLATFAALNVSCMAMAGLAAGCGVPFYAGLAAASAQLSWQVSTVNFDDGSDCAAKFKSNWWYGALLFSGIISEKLLAV